MDSPKRKLQKNNSRLRYKTIRKIKDRRRAEQQKQSKIAEKELKRRLKFTPRKFEDGKIGYVRQNGNPISFNNDGDLIDQITGQRGTMVLPEVIVNGRDFRKENDFRWRLQHELPDGGIRFGDFIEHVNGNRTVSSLGLESTYPEFDVMSFLKIPTGSSIKSIRKPYVAPSIKANGLGDLIDISRQTALSYANSKQRELLYNEFIQEAKNKGFIDKSFVPVRQPVKQNPTILAMRLDKNTKGAYRYSSNIIKLDPAKMDGITAYHEFLHNLRIGNAPSFLDDPIYNHMAQNSVQADDIQKMTQKQLVDYMTNLNKRLYLMENYNNLSDFYIKKARQAVLLQDGYINTPHELSVIGNTTGVRLGIPLFSEYPGDVAMNNIIKQAIKTEPWMKYVKRSTPEEKQTFWKILTGNYIPSFLGASTIGTKIYNDK